MIIVDLLYELARTHKQVRGYRYNKAYEKGAGNDMYPLVWLDDPILGRANAGKNVLEYTLNVDFLAIPETDADAENIQSAMQLIGLSFAEQIGEKYRHLATVSAFSFVTLRNYYDDNAAGQRFTYTITMANPLNRCADYFDEDKQITRPDALPSFSTENPGGCAIFSDKLPNFDV